MCSHDDAGRPIEAARPAGEEQAVEAQADALAEALVPFHESVRSELTDDRDPIPLSTSTAIRRRLSVLFSRHADAISARFEAMTKRGAELGRAAAVRRYGLEVSPSFDFDVEASERAVGGSAVQDLRRSSDRAFEAVRSRMLSDATNVINDAAEDGLDRSEIRDRLDDETLSDARTTEALRIADTEVAAGSNRGALAAYEDAGVGSKTWQAKMDESTRPAHAEVSGQTVAIGAVFVVDGHEARYPGDYRLPVGQRASCRCWLRPGN